MLHSFSCENYYSIREPMTLSMHRNKRMKSKEVPESWDSSYSPVAAIYGPNASGKTSVFLALNFISAAVRESFAKWEPDAGVPRVPFLLDRISEKLPSRFQIEFTDFEGQEYQYGFETDGSQFTEEWLYLFATANKTIIFERGFQENEDFIRYGKSFKGERGQLTESAIARPNALILSIGGQFGNSTLRGAFRWVSTGIRGYMASAYQAGLDAVEKRVEREPDFARRLSLVLSRADLGVQKIAVTESHDDSVKELLGVLSRFGDSDDELDSPNDFKQLALTHTSVDGSRTLPFGWESDGTQALIAFASVALIALETGSVCLVDEIDASLHPALVSELVCLFQSHRTNPNQAQMIFTTHDATLLARTHGDPVLQRDQIWIAEKSEYGSTNLVGLDEYETPRSEENLMRGYLTGRYGGLPVISILEALVLDDEADEYVKSPGS